MVSPVSHAASSPIRRLCLEHWGSACVYTANVAQKLGGQQQLDRAQILGSLASLWIAKLGPNKASETDGGQCDVWDYSAKVISAARTRILTPGTTKTWRVQVGAWEAWNRKGTRGRPELSCQTIAPWGTKWVLQDRIAHPAIKLANFSRYRCTTRQTSLPWRQICSSHSVEMKPWRKCKLNIFYSHILK